MKIFRNALSQTGTRPLAHACAFLLLSAVLGCAQEDLGDARDPSDEDTEEPQQHQDMAEVCAEHATAIAQFVAAHDDCTTDADCVIVGDCSHADFQSVAKSAADEARALVLGNPCGALDGPTYNAVCRANKCERVPSGEACGQVPQTACPDGTQRFEPGCGTGGATIEAGCYAPCSAGDDSGCAPGFSCQVAQVDPDSCTPGGGVSCDDACGVEKTLCLPAPACEVELAITLGSGRTLATVREGASTELKVWLMNRTDRALELTFDAPCHGPRIAGLGEYDVWNSCLAGACLTDPVRTTLTLAPGEKRTWRSAVLSDVPSTCNAAGLPDGHLALAFALPGLTGATVCGSAPVTLLSGSAAN